MAIDPFLQLSVKALNGSEAGGDLVLIKTSLSLLCKSSYVVMLTSLQLHRVKQRGFVSKL